MAKGRKITVKLNLKNAHIEKLHSSTLQCIALLAFEGYSYEICDVFHIWSHLVQDRDAIWLNLSIVSWCVLTLLLYVEILNVAILCWLFILATFCMILSSIVANFPWGGHLLRKPYYLCAINFIWHDECSNRIFLTKQNRNMIWVLTILYKIITIIQKHQE